MEEAVENLRPHFAALLAVRNENGQGLTQQGMADKLNADGVLSTTGQPWSKYSVRRILKKLDMQTEISASQTRGSSPPPPVSSMEAKERDLDDKSPLRQWSYYESIRGVIEELTAQPHTLEELAQQLNDRGVATSDGMPWDERAVTRALRTLKPSNSGVDSSDDEIRNRIRQGWYDTDTESFIAVPRGKKAGKKLALEADSKKDKKSKKGKKGKGKKKK